MPIKSAPCVRLLTTDQTTRRKSLNPKKESNRANQITFVHLHLQRRKNLSHFRAPCCECNRTRYGMLEQVQQYPKLTQTFFSLNLKLVCRIVSFGVGMWDHKLEGL